MVSIRSVQLILVQGPHATQVDFNIQLAWCVVLLWSPFVSAQGEGFPTLFLGQCPPVDRWEKCISLWNRIFFLFSSIFTLFKIIQRERLDTLAGGFGPMDKFDTPGVESWFKLQTDLTDLTEQIWIKTPKKHFLNETVLYKEINTCWGLQINSSSKKLF